MGYGVEVISDDPSTMERIRRDYSYFVNEDVSVETTFEIFSQSPDYRSLPSLKAKFYTPRNICYREGDKSFIDYFGKGLTVIDHAKNRYRVYASDPDIRHEIVFLSILSLAGQSLDARHLHRVHSVALEIHGEAVLILLPSGGGKTTLLMELIKQEGVRLISEDSPLINAQGEAIPFPMRIGVTQESKPKDIPESELHLIHRMEFGSKYVIDIRYFKNKIVQKPLPVRYVFCGVRCLGETSAIEPLSKTGAWKEMIANSVVGVGLYQGVEFLLQNGLSGLLKMSHVVFSRLKNAHAVLSRAKTYSLVLGSDRQKNVKTLLEFLAGQRADS